MKPYIVLETYSPPIWKCWKIGEDLTALTAKLGLKPLHDGVLYPQDWCPWVSFDLHAEVKRWTPDHEKSESFHQDGDLDPGANMNHALVLWTTKFPTELSYNGRIYQANPFECILFRNLALSHRRPHTAPRDEERYFFRQRVQLPKHIKLP